MAQRSKLHRMDDEWYRRQKERQRLLDKQRIHLDLDAAARKKALEARYAGPTGLTPRGSTRELERSKNLVRGAGAPTEEEMVAQARLLAKLAAQNADDNKFEEAVVTWLAESRNRNQVERFFADPAGADTIELQLAQGRIKDHRGVERFAKKLEYRAWWPGKKVLPPEWKPPPVPEGEVDLPPPPPPHPGNFCGVCLVVPAEIKWNAGSSIQGFLCRHCREHKPPSIINSETAITQLPEWKSTEALAEEAREREIAGRPPRGGSRAGGMNVSMSASVVFGIEREPVAGAVGVPAAPRPAAAAAAGRLEVITSVDLSQNSVRVIDAPLVASVQQFLLFRRTETLLRLDISNNNLTAFPPTAAAALPNLRMLYLHANNIAETVPGAVDPEDDDSVELFAAGPIGALLSMTQLEKLSLHGNPMCVTRLPNGAVRKKKGYRMQIITMVPWLKMLDATTVTPKEGEDAVVHQQQVKKERTFLSPERLRRIRVASPTRRMWGSDVKDTREPETSAVGKSMSSISIAEYTDGGGV